MSIPVSNAPVRAAATKRPADQRWQGCSPHPRVLALSHAIANAVYPCPNRQLTELNSSAVPSPRREKHDLPCERLRPSFRSTEEDAYGKPLQSFLPATLVTHEPSFALTRGKAGIARPINRVIGLNNRHFNSWQEVRASPVTGKSVGRRPIWCHRSPSPNPELPGRRKRRLWRR